MEFFPKVIFSFSLWGREIPVTETVVVTWGIMAFLMVFGVFAGRGLRRIPQGLQRATEILYEEIENLVNSIFGEERREFIPYIGTLGLYLVIANLVGLITLRPPTADLSTTLALALITFGLTLLEGLKSKGVVGYIKGFFQPMIFMTPLNIIGAVTNPMSLAFRLFGNILGGMVVMGLVYSAAPVFVPIPLHFYFDIFSGLLQTFIFVMLTLMFIAMASD